MSNPRCLLEGIENIVFNATKTRGVSEHDARRYLGPLLLQPGHAVYKMAAQSVWDKAVSDQLVRTVPYVRVASPLDRGAGALLVKSFYNNIQFIEDKAGGLSLFDAAIEADRVLLTNLFSGVGGIVKILGNGDVISTGRFTAGMHKYGIAAGITSLRAGDLVKKFVASGLRELWGSVMVDHGGYKEQGYLKDIDVKYNKYGDEVLFVVAGETRQVNHAAASDYIRDSFYKYRGVFYRIEIMMTRAYGTMFRLYSAPSVMPGEVVNEILDIVDSPPTYDSVSVMSKTEMAALVVDGSEVRVRGSLPVSVSGECRPDRVSPVLKSLGREEDVCASTSISGEGSGTGVLGSIVESKVVVDGRDDVDLVDDVFEARAGEVRETEVGYVDGRDDVNIIKFCEGEGLERSGDREVLIQQGVDLGGGTLGHSQDDVRVRDNGFSKEALLARGIELGTPKGADVHVIKAKRKNDEGYASKPVSREIVIPSNSVNLEVSNGFVGSIVSGEAVVLRESLESVEIVSESDVREVMAAPPYDDSSPLVDKTKPRCVKFFVLSKADGVIPVSGIFSVADIYEVVRMLRIGIEDKAKYSLATRFIWCVFVGLDFREIPAVCTMLFSGRDMVARGMTTNNQGFVVYEDGRFVFDKDELMGTDWVTADEELSALRKVVQFGGMDLRRHSLGGLSGEWLKKVSGKDVILCSGAFEKFGSGMDECDGLAVIPTIYSRMRLNSDGYCGR